MTTGRFQITRVLGAGATAVVVLCRDLQAERSVALKVLRDDALNDKSAVDRLRDEGRILTQVTHRNIAACYELLDYDGRPVLVMEAVEGVSLLALLRACGTLDGRVCLEIGAQLADVLDHTWNAVGSDGRPMHLVHRDVTPDNVLLSVDGVPKLIDFGIAKGSFTGREAKSLFLVQTSSGFMAPERSVELDDGPSVDVYGLCATLYTLLTGHVPVLSKNRQAHETGLAEHVARLPLIDGVNPEGLATLITEMADWDPEKRTEMGAVAARLRMLLGGQVDLGAFATEVVLPMVEDITETDAAPRTEVRFIEETLPQRAATPLSAQAVAKGMRRLIAQPGWEKRLPEVQRLLARGERFVARPLVEVLDRADVPWYRPLTRQARPGELQAALMLLCDHADSGVIERAQRLEGHGDARVQAAARFLLGHARNAG